MTVFCRLAETYQTPLLPAGTKEGWEDCQEGAETGSKEGAEGSPKDSQKAYKAAKEGGQQSHQGLVWWGRRGTEPRQVVWWAAYIWSFSDLVSFMTLYCKQAKVHPCRSWPSAVSARRVARPCRRPLLPEWLPCRRVRLPSLAPTAGLAHCAAAASGMYKALWMTASTEHWSKVSQIRKVLLFRSCSGVMHSVIASNLIWMLAGNSGFTVHLTVQLRLWSPGPGQGPRTGGEVSRVWASPCSVGHAGGRRDNPTRRPAGDHCHSFNVTAIPLTSCSTVCQ